MDQSSEPTKSKPGAELEHTANSDDSRVVLFSVRSSNSSCSRSPWKWSKKSIMYWCICRMSVLFLMNTYILMQAMPTYSSVSKLYIKSTRLPFTIGKSENGTCATKVTLSNTSCKRAFKREKRDTEGHTLFAAHRCEHVKNHRIKRHIQSKRLT
uniref:Uncharacterized protein n=1 Tax=Anopheles coluzzii TaxID=1518534 RepID=A0A8W7PIJ0_ANOCL